MSDNVMSTFESKAFALCPLDGRYAEVGEKLSPYFSEYALVKNRLYVEIRWLIYLHSIKVIEGNMSDDKVWHIFENFSIDSFKRIKEIESKTNHDVKAVELYVAEQLKQIGCSHLVSYVHIGCTSEDINNTAYALMIKCALNMWMCPALNLTHQIKDMAQRYKNIPMLAHTHGQPATPTTVGKELMVYAYRFQESLMNLLDLLDTSIYAKFNGATGNYSALSVAYPELDWSKICHDFIQFTIGVSYNPVTTQIESHDYICHIADGIRHFNNILLDLDLDMWLYISMDYFKQIPVKGEVGSSTMPHKVNPIRFENSESNIDLSNALLVALSNKLPHSRMQRDLSDSSSQRNIGLAFGYSLQAIEQTMAGLKKVSVNEEKISSELNNNWEVLAEPIQTMLRKYGIPDAYDTLKELTRGKKISKEIIQEFVNSLDMLSEKDKETLLSLTPATYIGYASKIVDDTHITI